MLKGSAKFRVSEEKTIIFAFLSVRNLSKSSKMLEKGTPASADVPQLVFKYFDEKKFSYLFVFLLIPSSTAHPIIAKVTNHVFME